MVVVVVVVMGLSAHKEVLDRPESLLIERAWSLWSGLEVAEVVRGPRPSVASPPPPPPLLGLLLLDALSWVKP